MANNRSKLTALDKIEKLNSAGVETNSARLFKSNQTSIFAAKPSREDSVRFGRELAEHYLARGDEKKLARARNHFSDVRNTALRKEAISWRCGALFVCVAARQDAAMVADVIGGIDAVVNERKPTVKPVN